MPKLLYTVNEACAALGCGRTRLYQKITDGRLDARKDGKRTMITGESLAREVESLPRAEILMGRRAAATEAA